MNTSHEARPAASLSTKVECKCARPEECSSDAYRAGTSIEDEKDLTLDSFPRSVSRSFVMGILEELGDVLHDFVEGRDAASLSLKTTICVNAPNHRKKANGFCSLGTE